MMDNDAVLPSIVLGIKFLLEVSYSSLALFDIIGGLLIDSFHIVSAHAPNCLVLRYFREITREGATFIWLPYNTLWNMENY